MVENEGETCHGRVTRNAKPHASCRRSRAAGSAWGVYLGNGARERSERAQTNVSY